MLSHVEVARTKIKEKEKRDQEMYHIKSEAISYLESIGKVKLGIAIDICEVVLLK